MGLHAAFDLAFMNLSAANYALLDVQVVCVWFMVGNDHRMVYTRICGAPAPSCSLKSPNMLNCIIEMGPS